MNRKMIWIYKLKIDLRIEEDIEEITWILKKNFENMMQFYPKWWMNLKNFEIGFWKAYFIL